MKVEKIEIKSDGYIRCKSSFYSALDLLNSCDTYEFTIGINKLIGDIDSGNWGISYLLSMYKYDNQNSLYSSISTVVNQQSIPIETLWEYTCYMDEIYPLFSSEQSINQLVTQGLESNKIANTVDEIQRMFQIDQERFQRPIQCIGNERYKAMAAVGYAHQKQVFCFPWFSKMRFDSFHNHMPCLFNVLKSLKKIVILPLGGDVEKRSLDIMP